MTDVHTPEQRRRNMSAVRSKDTRPEMLVRRGLHARGFRYRLHERKLAGHPDLVLKRHRAVVFVHGCFWHGHGCALFRWPKSRAGFWRSKILRNREIDARASAQLRSENWQIITVWECALRGRGRLALDTVIDRIEAAIRSGGPEVEIAGLVSDPQQPIPRTR